MNSSMGCSSVCEKNKDGMCGEKLKEITLKTLDKLSFWLEIFALNQVEENL